ncbi:MAG TPA: hypothetical protein VE035_16640, partial [Puia sp.]|nr:hypothetical protein [Puia sp.]
MVKFAFRQENYEKWLADFAAQFDSRPEGNTFTLPAHIGKGKIMAYNMTAQLSCLLMNFKLEEDLEIQREVDGRPGFSLSFNQVESADL